MPRKKSEFLKSFGLVMEIWKAIIEAVLMLGGSDDDLRRIVTQKGLAVEIAKVIMAKAMATIQPITQVAAVAAKEVSAVFKAMVEYAQPTYEDLKTAFDWVDSDYRAAKFEAIDRCKGVARVAGELTLHYVHLGRDASTDEILAEMDRLGFRPALYEELLAFGRQYPDEQRKYPVVALGSTWVISSGRRGVAVLFGGGSGRYLSLGWYGVGWGGGCRFLAVPVSK